MQASAMNFLSTDEAVAEVRSGQRIFIQGAASTPTELLQALARREDLENVELVHLHTQGPAVLAAPELKGRFRSLNLFTGENQRAAVAEGRSDFVPIFLSDIPDLFKRQMMPLDWAFIHVSTPDRHGHCTLGPSVDVTRAAVDHAAKVVAQVNPLVPRTHGDTFVSTRQIARATYVDRPLHTIPPIACGEAEEAIGRHVANLIEDGSVLQLGIGTIAEAVARAAVGKRELRIHSEMFSDAVVDLAESGALDPESPLVTSFVMGSQRLFDFVDDNVKVHFHPSDFTNDTHRIGVFDKMVAVNSAIEIDLTGQVCADSIGTKIFSGIGGQMDFIRGAARSRGGKPIIALPATASGGKFSRIVPLLKPGAGVVTTRGHVHWVVTEFGAVNLHGKTLRQRGEALVSIAHPNFREELTASLRERLHY